MKISYSNQKDGLKWEIDTTKVQKKIVKTTPVLGALVFAFAVAQGCPEVVDTFSRAVTVVTNDQASNVATSVVEKASNPFIEFVRTIFERNLAVETWKNEAASTLAEQLKNLR